MHISTSATGWQQCFCNTALVGRVLGIQASSEVHLKRGSNKPLSNRILHLQIDFPISIYPRYAPHFNLTTLLMPAESCAYSALVAADICPQCVYTAQVMPTTAPGHHEPNPSDMLAWTLPSARGHTPHAKPLLRKLLQYLRMPFIALSCLHEQLLRVCPPHNHNNVSCEEEQTVVFLAVTLVVLADREDDMAKPLLQQNTTCTYSCDYDDKTRNLCCSLFRATPMRTSRRIHGSRGE